MSTRDWSEFSSNGESSVHGNDVPCCGGNEPEITPVQKASSRHYRAMEAKKAAIEKLSAPKKQISGKLMNLQYECEDSQRPYPRFLRDAIKEVEDHNSAVYEEAVEKFLESDEAEAILKELIDSKKELDHVIAEENEKKKKAEDKFSVLKSFNGFIITGCREHKNEIVEKTGIPGFSGNFQSIKDQMVMTVTEALKITEKNNKDKFIPSQVMFFNEQFIIDVGYGADIQRIKNRITTN